MDEAKQLINMFVSVVFSCAILVAVAGLIYMSQTFTRHFDRQEQQSARMQEYAEYASYDNKNVRGQEIISLIDSHRDDIFILIYNNNNESIGSYKNEDGYRTISQLNGKTVDQYYKDLFTSTTLLAYSGSKTIFQNYASSGITPNGSCVNVPSSVLNDSQKQRLNNLTNEWQAMADRTMSNCLNLYDMTDEELVQTFTCKSHKDAYNNDIIPNLCGFVKSSPNESTTGINVNYLIDNPQFEGTYAPFHGNLIYADEASSEVVGIIFTRLPTIDEEVP